MTQPSTPTDLAVPRAPVWPLTLVIVLAGLTLLAWDFWVAVITTAPFFGEQPSGDDLAGAGMTLQTALVPVGLLTVLGLLVGSRFGLLVLVMPAGLAALTGSDLLTRAGTAADAPRAWGPADAFAEPTWVNWAAAAVVLLVVAAAVLRRRRRRT